MDVEQGLFRDLVLWLSQQADQPSQRDEMSDLYLELQNTYLPVEHSRELESALETDGDLTVDLLARRKFLYLEPVPNDGPWWPLFTFICDFASDRPLIRLYVGMFSFQEDAAANGSRVRGFGFRLETPEGSGGGRHDFYHAQLITRFRRRADHDFLTGVPTWLPDSQPSVPVRADSPVALLVALVVTLYDARGAGRLLGAPFANEVRKYLAPFIGDN